MNRTTTTVAASLALAAALTLTACTPAATDPAPGTFTTLPAPSSSAAGPAIPAWLGGVADEAAARDALAAGRPFLFGIPSHPSSTIACHTALLVPGQPRAWIMNEPGAAPTDGRTMELGARDLYGCATAYGAPSPGVAVPAQPTATAPLNVGALIHATRSGAPFIYGEVFPACGGGATTTVVLPSGTMWTANRSGPAPLAGVALSDVATHPRCTAGPTAPTR